MKLDIYLKRQRISLEEVVNIIGAKSYLDVFNHFKSIGIKCPPEDQLNYEFKKENVEERPVISSSNKKSRISNKKNGESQADDSVSARRSTPKQQASKSTPKRRRKRNSKKVESVQSDDGSESSK